MHGKYVIVIRSVGFIGSSLIKTLTKDNDVIRTNLLVAENNIIGVFNVAAGRNISASELKESIIEINNDYGENIEIIYDNPQPADIRTEYSFTDISKIDKVGFEPECSLANGLKKTSDCFSKETIMNF